MLTLLPPSPPPPDTPTPRPGGATYIKRRQAAQLRFCWSTGHEPARLEIDMDLCTEEQLEEARVALDRIFLQTEPHK